ncbi:MAG: choice-of-anchor B domain-containing protein [Myxococcota bacterium]|jgi:choice-of-anchor B domain-containing protein
MRSPAVLTATTAALLAFTAVGASAVSFLGNDHQYKADGVQASATAPATALASVPCVDGKADTFACDGFDLLGFVPDDSMITYRDPLTSCALDIAVDVLDGTPGATNPSCLLDQTGLSDIWGWTSPTTGDEFVLFGKTNGTAIYNITDPTDPEYYGEIPTIAGTLLWHDIKVFGDHAYIASESVGAGIVVFDLTQLDSMSAAAFPFFPIAPTNRFVPNGSDLTDTSVHNLVIDTDNGILYLVGGNAGIVIGGVCDGGLYAMDLNQSLTNPPFLGCFAAAPTVETVDGAEVTTDNAYTHDAQCAAYIGPDTDYAGKDICVVANEEIIAWVDVTDPTAMTEISRISYGFVSYAHQGWMSEDQTVYFHGDELDELDFPEDVSNTRTIVVDMSDLDNPVLDFIESHDTVSIDHNMYTHNGLLYQSNYTAGLRVFDVRDLSGTLDADMLTEVAFFDTYPDDDDAPVTEFNGTWSVYPYFASGTIAVTGIGEGLFLLGTIEDEQVAAPTPTPTPTPDDEVKSAVLANTGGGAAALAAVALGAAAVLRRRRDQD